jgi:3-methylfumaryl-CoA hydratase
LVEVRHHIFQRGQIVVDERQDIAYREASAPAGRSASVPVDSAVVPAANDEWVVEVSPVLLFRFSVLTYNAHRIHYDRDYARDVEGYRGLLTHGPLQALAMAESARAVEGEAERGTGHDFSYRLESPLFDYQGMIVGAVRERDAILTSVRDNHGRQTASGTLRSNGP